MLAFGGWGAAVGIALFGWSQVRHRQGEQEWAGLLLAFSLLMAWVLVDDVLQIHEDVFPKQLGIRSRYPVGIVFLWGLTWMLRYPKAIARHAVWPVGIAAAGFGLAALTVAVHVDPHEGEARAEPRREVQHQP